MKLFFILTPLTYIYSFQEISVKYKISPVFVPHKEATWRQTPSLFLFK